MRFEEITSGVSCKSSRYQLLFQGEIISGHEALPGAKKNLDGWPSLKGVIERIRPGQFAILNQDLDFDMAKKQMKSLVNLGIIAYIEPMGSAFFPKMF